MKTADLLQPKAEPKARPSRPTGPAADAARGRRRVKRWLRQLGDLGTMLVALVDGILANRRADPAMPRTIDVTFAWALMRRAGRWMRALRIRLGVEAKAARAGQEPRESDHDGEDWHEDLLRRPAWLRPQREPAISLDGTPTEDVFAQICADLNAAAKVLRSPWAMEKIAAIAAAARALLGGPAAGWTPQPVDVRRDDAAAALMNPNTPPPLRPLPPDSG